MRRYSLPVVSAVAVAVGTAILVAPPAEAAPGATNSCPAGAVFAVGGTWDPTGQSTQPVIDRYVAQGYAAEPVSYPASFWPLGDQTYDASVAAGVAALRNDVNTFHAQCPGSKIAVTGYSQGARIAGDVLEDIARDGSIPQSQVEGVLYADPRSANGGIETVVPNIVPGVTMSGTRPGFGAIPVQEVCIAGDGICNMPEPQNAPAVFVDSVFGYFTKHNTYQPMMAEPESPTPPALPAPPAVPLDNADVVTAIVSRVVENITPYLQDAAKDAIKAALKK